mgnify:CR=1 FL=1
MVEYSEYRANESNARLLDEGLAMKNYQCSSVSIGGFMFRIFILAVSLSSSLVAQAVERPNIVLMLADDQGWSGTSVAMHPDVPGSTTY